jgi:hypothetical protein
MKGAGDLMADDRSDQQSQPRPGEWRDVLAPEVMERYIGKHIAIIHKRIVAAGDTYEFVREEAQRLYPDETPYLAFIPIVAQPTTPPEQTPASAEASELGKTGGAAGSPRRRRKG